MKKQLLVLLCATFSTFSYFGQFNTAWSTSSSNSVSAGYVGIGIKPTTGSTAQAAFNLHLHGVADYIETTPAPLGGGPAVSVNWGKTARFGMTNSTSGTTLSDGTLFMMAGNNFHLINREEGSLTVGVVNTNLRFSKTSNRAWMGDPVSASETDQRFGRLNISSSDNALFLQTTNLSKTALCIKYISDNGKAIEVFGTDALNSNFKVFTSGFVYARKFVTSLSNFPDYVFSENYPLMPLDDLRIFIATNKHLPNVPTAQEIEKDGADLGELNRVLVEKVEELTLYLLEMEQRLKELEGKK